MPVTHAVEARQVRRRFGSRDDVVRRDRVFGMRQRYRNDLASRFRQFLDCSFHCGANFRIESLAKIFFRNAEPQPFRRLPNLGLVIGDGNFGGSRVEFIASGDIAQQDGRVFHRLRQRTNVIKRRRKRDQSVARNAPVRGQQSHHSAKSRWLTNRSAGIRSQCRDCQVCGHRRCASTRRSARHA